MADFEYQVRLAAFQRGRQVHLSIAELGVLLTAVNRAINSREQPFSPTYVPRFQEPARIRTDVVSLRNGSVFLTLVSSIADKVLSLDFLVGVAGNATWDLTKALSKEVRKALRRLGKGVIERAPIEPTFNVEEFDQAHARVAGQSVTYSVSVLRGAQPVMTITFTVSEPRDR